MFVANIEAWIEILSLTKHSTHFNIKKIYYRIFYFYLFYPYLFFFRIEVANARMYLIVLSSAYILFVANIGAWIENFSVTKSFAVFKRKKSFI